MQSKILWCFLVLAISEIASETTLSRNPKDFWTMHIERPKFDFVEFFNIYHRPTNHSKWSALEVPAGDHTYSFDGIHCGPAKITVKVHNSLASESPKVSIEMTVKAPEGKDDCLLTHFTTIKRLSETEKFEESNEAYVGAIVSWGVGSPKKYRDLVIEAGSASNVREIMFQFKKPQ